MLGACLFCRYPLAPSHSDKLGHENKPPRCQENAKYRSFFLWQCLFNQLPLISALHPLFLSFQNVMEEKSVPPTSFPLNAHPPPPSLLTCSFVYRCVSPSLPQSLPFLLPPYLFSAMQYLFSISFPHAFLALPLAYFPLASLVLFFSVAHPSLLSNFCIPSPYLYFFFFHLSLLSTSSIVFLPA